MCFFLQEKKVRIPLDQLTVVKIVIHCFGGADAAIPRI